MTKINKVPISKVNNTLVRLPLTGQFNSQLSVIDQAAKELKASQSTVLGKTVNETISGVKALTQPDEYPTDILTEPPIAQITEEADPALKKTSAQISNINKMTSSSLSGNGFMNTHIISGTPQSIKNGIFNASGVEPNIGKLQAVVPDSLKSDAAVSLPKMKAGQDFVSQITSSNDQLASTTANISFLASSLLSDDFTTGVKNIGVTQKAVLKSQNYFEEFLKAVSQNTLTEDEIIQCTNLILDGKNNDVIIIVQNAAIRENVNLDPSGDFEKSIIEVSSSSADAIDIKSSALSSMGSSTRKTRDLATLNKKWSGASTKTTPGEYNFEKVNSIEELVADLRNLSRDITEVIVHWTAHFNDQGHVGAKEVHEIALKRGFAGCSYHYIIKRNGDLERGRPVELRGAHAKEAGHNNLSIGIAFVAGYNCPSGTSNPNRFISAESITPAQYKTFDMFLKGFFMIYPGGQVFGHQDFDDNKVDPGFDVGTYIEARFNKKNVTNPHDGPATPAQIASIVG